MFSQNDRPLNLTFPTASCASGEDQIASCRKRRQLPFAEGWRLVLLRDVEIKISSWVRGEGKVMDTILTRSEAGQLQILNRV